MAAAFFGLITLAAAKGWTAGMDEAVRGFCREHQVTVINWLAIGLNKLGQGVVVAWILGGGLTLLLLWRTRRWQAVLPWAMAFFLTYITLGPIKIWSMRTSPNSNLPNAVEFFNEAAKADGYAMGFPSGHVVNSIVWWGVTVLAASRLWDIPARWQLWMRLAPPVIVLCTTTYLGHHWLTDGLAAVAVGLLIDRLIHRLRWEDMLPR
ncbi:MAG TPA: PA-phosphatase [Micromonosporaceae bacterium]|nr:PA-phosphatase [Micromonosporaceae bacterium]